MSRALVKLIGAGALVGLFVSCAPAPIYRPIKGGDVDTGVGTLEDVRARLKGTWALMAYEVYENGKPRRLPAQGELTYDEFGNLKLVGQLKRTDTGSAAKPPMLLNYSGRTVIDVRSHEFRLLDVNEGKEPLPGAIQDAVNPANVRKCQSESRHALVAPGTRRQGTTDGSIVVEETTLMRKDASPCLCNQSLPPRRTSPSA